MIPLIEAVNGAQSKSSMENDAALSGTVFCEDMAYMGEPDRYQDMIYCVCHP